MGVLQRTKMVLRVDSLSMQSDLAKKKKTDSSFLLFDSGRKQVALGEATMRTRKDGDGKPRLMRKLPKRAPLKQAPALLSSPFSHETGGSVCTGTLQGRLKHTVSQHLFFSHFSLACDNLELQRRYPNLHAPLSLFHVQLCWPESFPPCQPLPLAGPCHFHIGSQQPKTEATPSPDSTDTSLFSVKVI